MPRDKEVMEKLAESFETYNELDMARQGVMLRVEALADALYDEYGEEGYRDIEKMVENVEEEITTQLRWLIRTLLVEEGARIADTVVRTDAEDGYADQWLSVIAEAIRTYADKKRGTGFALLYEDQARQIEGVTA